MEYNIITLEEALDLLGYDSQSSETRIDNITIEYLENIQMFHKRIWSGSIFKRPFPFESNSELINKVYRYNLGHGGSLGFYEILELNRYNANGARVASPLCISILRELYKSRHLRKDMLREKQDNKRIREYEHKNYNYENYAKHNNISTNNILKHDQVFKSTFSIREQDLWTYTELTSLANFINTQHDVNTLFVTPRLSYCEQHGHKIIPITGIYLGKKLDVCYCLYCKEYYISPSKYENYCNEYGKENLPVIKLKKDESPYEKNILHIKNRMESKLTQRGYNVKKNENLPTELRHNIIISGIKAGAFTKPEVINRLEANIRISSTRTDRVNAIKKWQEDLNWLRDYEIFEQKQVIITNITHK